MATLSSGGDDVIYGRLPIIKAGNEILPEQITMKNKSNRKNNIYKLCLCLTRNNKNFKHALVQKSTTKLNNFSDSIQFYVTNCFEACANNTKIVYKSQSHLETDKIIWELNNEK